MWALAMAAEKVGLKKPINNIENISTMNSINLFNFRISQTSPKVLEAMLGTTFEGLNSQFCLLNGQLKPSPFQILNIVGKQGREVGIWRQSYGISKNFNENTT
ncbi:hypothetical protein CsSME_00052434 [Camellia sinensis var. sinensis]